MSRKGHPLQREGRLDPARLSKEHWAMPAAGTLPAQWLAQRWRELGIESPLCVARSSSLPTLLSIVSETNVLTFQSWSAVRRATGYAAKLRPLECEELTWHRDLGATLRDHGYVSPAIGNFIRILRDAAGAEESL
jgi:DNA-binding transcriptional LysR family regulator